ncbi:MAG: ACP S-malonyltransferase [Gammaproteobacteria bacterium]|nr:ACP S-malonyltransferase [Gammaproteobacteria bacterium]
MRIGYIFPGQGAQAVGMLADLRANFAHIDERLSQASKIINEDLVRLITAGPEERLNETEITQPVMLAMSVALFDVWCKAGGAMPTAVAGHSLGEYSALTAVGVFDFDEAIALVHERGKLMQAAVPKGEGAMAAVLGLELDELASICEDVEGVVTPANINSPGQVVIAGAATSVEIVVDRVLAEGDKRKRVVPLDVSVPSHCELMKPAADGVERLLSDVTMHEPSCPIFQNVDAMPTQAVTEIRDRLIRQLTAPVRWADCVTTMVASGCEMLIECGPGKVLTGLARRIDRHMNCKAIGSVDDFDSVLEATA